MKNKKSLLIVISIILGLVIASAVAVYVYLMTDTLRNEKELFLKYFSQNTEALNNITNLKTVELLRDLKNEKQYQMSSKVEMSYSEGGEISNPINNISFKLDVEKNLEENYVYADGQVLCDCDEYIEAEILKKDRIYGVRFSDAFKRFISIENDENIEKVVNDIGFNIEQIEYLINFMDGNKSIIEEQKLYELKEGYKEIIEKAILNGSFQKQKNAIITYNNVTTKTNSYSLQLDEKQVEDLIIEILNYQKNETSVIENLPLDFNNEETTNIENLPLDFNKEEFANFIDNLIYQIKETIEIPSIKVVVYENKQQTIRTVFEIGLYKIVIENVGQNNELTTKIQYLNNNNYTQYDIVISKNNINNEENLQIEVGAKEEEQEYKITVSNEFKSNNNNIEIVTKVGSERDITNFEIVLKNTINIGNFIPKIGNLNSDNNIVLNDATEEKRKSFMEILKPGVEELISERIQILTEKIGLNIGNDQTQTISQVEINKFNSKFEFYSGDDVSSENVISLLNVVKNHLGKYEIISNESQEQSSNSLQEKINIKLTIEKDSINEGMIENISNMINEKKGKKYSVSIYYKDPNGMIDYITIKEK